ncbi:hypothetical protein F4604DRAFT_1929863 [Suillus subluteus]|nr:hypothetical protein F4604DRAFT_1929863 [Suillus subluteus]
MATSVVPQDDFLMAVWSIQVMNYTDGLSSRSMKQGISDEHIVVAVTALWVYDLLLRFQQEATFLAQANKNVAKFLYIGARYMPLLIAVPGLIFDQVSHMGNVDCQSVGDLATGRASAITDLKVVLTTIISSLRFVPGQYVFVPDVPACKTLQVTKEQRLLVAFLALLTLELILVIFTAIRAVKNYGSTSRPLLTLLLTHHMFYYGCGFLFSMINVLCVALFEYEYAAVLFNPQIMMHAILATRMHYRLWESEDAQRSYRSEQYPMPSLFWQPPEETATS